MSIIKSFHLKFLPFLILPFCLNAQTTTFSFTGAVQNYTIPASATQLTITTRGAQGGGNSTGSPGIDVLGGLGALITSTFPVGGANPLQPGQTIFIYVGGEGDTDGLLGGTSLGGFNGGGNGPTGNDVNGGGGGGASDIRAGGMALGDRIIIAAGGGGAGNNPVNTGGAGGDNIGGTGLSGADPNAGVGGTGGTQAVGGTGGTGVPAPSRNGANGALGLGGNGGFTGSGGGGAGGGGGFFGGGGGGASNLESGGAGGGGSSFTSGSNSQIVAGCGTCTGNGQIIIASSSQVPTLSEWGLIILTLSIISIGLIFSTQQEIIFIGGLIPSISSPYFNKSLFLKYFGLSFLGISIIGIIAILNFGYKIMPFDFIGSIISAGFIGFMFQILINSERKKF